MIQADLIVEGAAELLTLTGNIPRPRRGEEMRDLGILRSTGILAGITAVVLLIQKVAARLAQLR